MTAVATRPPSSGAAPPRSPRETIALTTNLAVAGLTLAAVFGLARLFTDPGRFFFPVAFVALAAHATCWGCRRAGLGLIATVASVAVSTVLLTSWLLFFSTTAFGIPGHGTAHAARLALSSAAQLYRSIAAPAPVVPGFTLAAAVGAALAAFLADWAAFRMRATIEACLPSFSLFVLSAALAQGQAEVGAGAVWLASLLIFLLVRHASVDSPPSAWFASRGGRGSRSVLISGAVIGAGAVALAAIVGPLLPGATIHPLFDWRHRNNGDSSRTIGVSPLVDITARLQSQSHEEVFTVAAARPTYWRLTSLDRFSGSGWSLKNEFVPTGGRLAPATGPSVTLRAQFEISALSSIWLPAPYRPTQISGVGGASFSSESGSLITNKATSDRQTYIVVSAVPAATPDELDAAPPTASNDPDLSRYLELPSLPAAVRQIAQTVTRGDATPYAQAKALQDWLRTPPFKYDLNVKADDSPNALLNFLTVTRAGFCQQFAAAYAVLARAIGLPTRVAVGFTEGNLEADGRYHVNDAQAHAWPEVYFQGIGWIAFDATPGRGSPDPAEQAITGVPPAQDNGTGGGTSPATTPASTPAARSAQPGATTAPRARVPGSDGGAGAVAAAHHHWWHNRGLEAAGGLAAAVALWVIGVNATGAVLRRRRTARARAPGAVVELAWTEASEALADAGVPRRAAETPAEFASRAARNLPPESRSALGELARAVEVAGYAPGGATAETVTESSAARDRIRSAISSERGWAQHIGRALDPRPTARLVAAEVDGFSRRRA